MAPPNQNKEMKQTSAKSEVIIAFEIKWRLKTRVWNTTEVFAFAKKNQDNGVLERCKFF